MLFSMIYVCLLKKHQYVTRCFGICMYVEIIEFYLYLAMKSHWVPKNSSTEGHSEVVNPKQKGSQYLFDFSLTFLHCTMKNTFITYTFSLAEILVAFSTLF